MAITIIATEGAANANSYLTLAEAESYLEAHQDYSVWSALDDEAKKAALISATRELDLIEYAGRKATQAQSLQWPRISVVDRDGYTITGVPKLLKDAVCEQVIYDLTEEDNIASEFDIEYLESVEVGPLKYKMKAGAKAGIPEDVKERLNAIGPGIVMTGQTAKVMFL